MGKTELMNNRCARSPTFLFQWRESAQSSRIQLGCCTETKDPSYSFSIWTPSPRTGTMAQNHPRHWVPWGCSVQCPAGSMWSWGCIRVDVLLWRGGLSVPRAFRPICCYLLGLYQQSWPIGRVLCQTKRLSTFTNISVSWVWVCLC